MNLRDAPWPAVVTALGDSALLPRLDAAGVRVRNRIYRRHDPWRLPLAGPQGPRTALMRWRDVDRADHDRMARFGFRVGASSGLIGLSAMAESMLLAERQAARLPHELRCVLLADVLAEVADKVAHATQQAFEWDLSPGPAPAEEGAALALCFEFALDEATTQTAFGYVASEDLALLEALAPLGRELADNGTDWDTLRMPLSFELGATTLTLRELRTIERGDIVAVEQWGAHGTSIEAAPVIGGRHRLNVRALADGSRVTLLFWKELTMSSIQHAADAASASSPAVALDRLDGIDVALRFEVGELWITLRELRGLQPGHVFELGQPLNRCTVRIHANGQVLGHGDLVAVGDRLGVRVSKFSADVDD